MMAQHFSLDQSQYRTRWARFRKQKLAVISLFIFIIIFVLSLGAPLIANDKPLLVSYQNSLYSPIIHNYPETTFGGVFETSADYQDPAVQALINKHGYIISAPLPYGEYSLVLDADTPHPSAPSMSHPLGTDDVGRDVLARILYALRVSLLFGIGLSVIGSMIGVLVGAVMGYFGGVADLLGQRLLEIWIGLPQLFVLIILASIFVPSTQVLFLLLLSFGWLTLVPMTRVHFMKMRREGYVTAAQNLGIHPVRIMLRHILPSTILLVLSQLPFVMVMNISALTTLDFLGLGLPVGTASLGELLAQGKNHLDAPHLVLSGFVVLAAVLSLLIFIGEGLRNAFDIKH